MQIPLRGSGPGIPLIIRIRRAKINHQINMIVQETYSRGRPVRKDTGILAKPIA